MHVFLPVTATVCFASVLFHLLFLATWCQTLLPEVAALSYTVNSAPEGPSNDPTC